MNTLDTARTVTRTPFGRARFGILAAVLIALLPCAYSCVPWGNADAVFESLRDRYFVQTLQMYPVTATYLGGSTCDPSLRRVDGRLRDTSRQARKREVAFYRKTQERLASLSAEDLCASNQIDYRVMEAQLNFVLHQLVDTRYHERAVDTYVGNPFSGIDWQIQGMTAISDEALNNGTR